MQHESLDTIIIGCLEPNRKHAYSCFVSYTKIPVWFEPPRDGTRPAAGMMHVVGKLGRPRAAHLK